MSNSIIHVHGSAPRVFVSMSRTINLGNYESIKLELGLNEDMELGTSHADAFKKLERSVYVELDKLCTYMEGKKKGGKK